MGTIWLLRHGQTTANAQEVIQGPRIDAPLSQVGRRQANALGLALSGAGLTALYTSPLLRARETAAAIAPHHDLAPLSLPELHEVDYGELVGQTYDACRPAMDAVLAAWRTGRFDVPYPGGESAAQAQRRVRAIATRLVKEAQDDGAVAAVAHGRINKVLLATLTGAGLARQDEFPQSNACINELEVVDGAAVLRRLNDTRHLPVTTHAFS